MKSFLMNLFVTLSNGSKMDSEPSNKEMKAVDT